MLNTFSNNPELNLPPVLKEIQALSTSDTDADIILLSSITAFSAILPKYSGTYGGRYYSPNLYLFITACASAGKGRIDIARQLVQPVHNALRQKSKLMKEQHIAESELTGKPMPEYMPNHMLFVPANSTSTALYQTIKENNSRGLIFETEADTLSQTLKNDMSNFSDGLRKAFHHEAITYLRRANNEYAEISNPQLSVVLAGTPQQVHRLIPDAENGLFSRFIIYQAPTNANWINVFSPQLNSLQQKLPTLAKQIYCLYQMFNQSDYNITFTLTDKQQDEFNNTFESMQTEYYNIHGAAMLASVRRLGLITFRIAMILTALRQIGSNCPLNKRHLECSDEDFRNAVIITQCVFDHILSIYIDMPDDNSTPELLPYQRHQIESFYNFLPANFGGDDIRRANKEFGYSSKTGYKYLKILIEKEHIKKLSRGTYEKI